MNLKTLKIEQKNLKNSFNSFVNAMFFAIRFNVEQKTDLCSLAELKESVDNNLFIQLNQEKFNIILDQQKFNNQCHDVNMLLAKHRYFLRVFELKHIPPSSTKKSKKNKTLLDNYLVV